MDDKGRESDINDWSTVDEAKRSSKRAPLATAYKLRANYVLPREHSHYRDLGIDYEQLQAQRNAPRSLIKLRQFGYVPEPANHSPRHAWESDASPSHLGRGYTTRPSARAAWSGAASLAATLIDRASQCQSSRGATC